MSVGLLILDNEVNEKSNAREPDDLDEQRRQRRKRKSGEDKVAPLKKGQRVFAYKKTQLSSLSEAACAERLRLSVRTQAFP